MATLLLKKSYRHKDLKEVNFNDLWNHQGVFTTMRVMGKPPKILFLNEHIKNLIESLKIYKIKNKNLKNNILKIISLNINKKKKFDHLLRIASNNKIISISLRKRFKIKSNFNLKIVNYQRIDPEIKNLKYKKIQSYLKKIDTTRFDIVLFKKNKFLETGTSNLLLIRKNKIYSPLKNFYKGITFKFFSKKIKINKQDIFINSLKNYEEIIIIGSGKGVVSVKAINSSNWKRRSLRYYRILSKIYQQALSNCPPYNG